MRMGRRWRGRDAALVATATAGLLLTGCAQTTLFKSQAREGRPDDSTVVSAQPAADEEPAAPDTDEDLPLLDRSAEEIFFLGMETSFGAESLRVVGLMEDQDGLLEMDMHYDLSGRCLVTMGMQDYGSVEVIIDEDEAWLRPDSAMVDALVDQDPEWEEFIRQIEGKYRHVTADEPGSEELLTLCSSDEFLDVMELIDIAGSTHGYAPWAEKGEPTTHEGVEVIPLDGNDGETWMSALVATEGEPYMRYLLVDSESDGLTEMWMSDFGVPVDIQAPPPDEVYGPDDLLFDFFGELYV